MQRDVMLRRRELLQVGSSTFFGLGLSHLLRGRTLAADERRVKSVVLVFLTGGGSHIDMFDPKPDAPEVRGEFGTISTQIPGVQFGELLPGFAARADRLAIIRSMSHGDNRHLSGSHNALTGAVQPFRGDSNQDKSLNRADWPCYGSAVDYVRPQPDRTPSHVTLPHPLIEGTLVWPGQHAGFLGPRYDPFQVRDDPNQDNFRVSGLSLIDGLSVGRLEGRWQLLQEIGRTVEVSATATSSRRFTAQQDSAYAMLTSGRLKQAFRMDEESPETRERYGRTSMGQTLLLARRLVEAEIPVIQCNMGIVQSWDTHVDHFARLKNNLLPPLDRGVSALLDDLVERGRLEETLLIVVGEFGRTPTISPLDAQSVPGRHHWAPAYSAVFAGGGVRGGRVIGQTDKTGAFPVTTPWHPNDMGATIYASLGIDPHTMVYDRLDRPIRLNQGKVMDVLYS
jgi:Protein of unknown function (DUF1501)